MITRIKSLNSPRLTTAAAVVCLGTYLFVLWLGVDTLLLLMR